MRKNNQKNKTILMLLTLFVVGLGIGYAILTQQLTIDNTISYDSMKWDVGFTSVENGYDRAVDLYIADLEGKYGSLEAAGFLSREEAEKSLVGNYFENRILATSTATISSDKKNITVNCKLEASTKYQSCIVTAAISNASTFNVALSEILTLSYNETYIENINVVWLKHSIFEGYSFIKKGQTLDIGETAEIIIEIRTKELTEDILPSNELSIPVTISLDFEETNLPISKLAMLKSEEYNSAFWTNTYRSNIKNITIENKINISDDAIETWDMSIAQNGKVMSYIVPNETDSTYYDLYIQSDTQLYANFNMSNWFSEFYNVDSINGLELLDTSYTTDMSYMFAFTGHDSTSLTLNVSNFDTSNVTNMNAMFFFTGYLSPTFSLDVSNFNTSNVTDMYFMFAHAGYSNPEFTLDVSNFDTSKVTNMARMFYETGYNSTKFITSITIKNPNTDPYYEMFYGVATKGDSKITVNYTSETSTLVDNMISDNETNSNVVKGVQVY